MDQKFASSSCVTTFLAQRSDALTGPFPKHQDGAGSALVASVALAASAVVGMPGCVIRGRSGIFRSLRYCAILSEGSSLQASGATTATAAAAGLHAHLLRSFRSKAVGCMLANAAAGAGARTGVGLRSVGRSGRGGSSSKLWGHLRQQLQLQPQREPQQLFLAPTLLRSGCSIFGAAAATAVTRVSGSAAAAVSAVARCGGRMGGQGLGPAGALPRPLLVRRMATQVTGTTRITASASRSAAEAGAGRRGLMSRAGSAGRMRAALRLQLAAAWHKYGTAAYAVGALAGALLLWRVMRGVTNTFIAVNDRMAEYGIMALAASLVLLGVLYAHWRTEINPAAVYRKAMVRLNTNPGVLEVMGAPLAGSPVRAYVVTGGGLYLSKKFRIKLRSKRVAMMFPLSGTDRKGLVSLEAKRKQGRYIWRLLAVDVGPELQQTLPAGGRTCLSAAPPQQPSAAAAAAAATQPPLEQPRLYVVGDAAAYHNSGVLGELRAPFLKALSKSRSYEVEDELEDELDELNAPKSSDVAMGRTTGVGAAVRRALASATAAFTKADAGGSGAETAAAAGKSSSGTIPQTPQTKGLEADASSSTSAAPQPPTPTTPAPGTTDGSWRNRLRGLVLGLPPAAWRTRGSETK
ncbi:hypothetical protein VaNZ11_010692 [Volvox africanus]|uniref:Uncharacterized protein n=1 Tax=Volvox africanus TaxID=51714 RepID=A0ABQ5SB87_9CHLO|nr:hypothetical protein VaNZ11_010692 [Volvox africanus]